MTQIRFKGFQTGQPVNLSDVTIGANSGAVNVAAFRAPVTVSGLPRVNSTQADGDTLTLDTTGLTGITGYNWRIVGGATQGTAATLNTTGLGLAGQWVECVVTCNEGTPVSPPIMVYAAGMMSSHNDDDAAILALCPHDEATHIAVADGSWTSAATWLNGEVPSHGARVLIPNGRTVTYNNSTEHLRLDWVRVDGVLTWALTQSTETLVETLVGTRGSSIIMGTSSGRLPSQYTARVVISGCEYRANSFEPTDISLARDPNLWGRGIICQGTWRAWGAQKLPWGYADPIDAGATSLTMHKVPTGWSVGDTIVVGGTSIVYTGHASGYQNWQDEEVEITNISGNTITFTPALTHPHKNQLATSTRTDLYPVVMLKRARNISIESEVTSPVWRRGHTAMVHHHSTTDLWDVQFIGLGRTDKSRAAGIKNSGGLFEIPDPDNAGSQITSTFTAQSNIISRYSGHGHHLGFGHTGARPIFSECYFEDVPGWGLVHHSCDMDIFGCVIYKFYGGGVVSESANELGAWVGCLVMHTTCDKDNLRFTPKLNAGNQSLGGDTFGHGYAYPMRGRAMRTNGNVAVSCAWGPVYFHREFSLESQRIASMVNLERQYIDLGEAGRFRNGYGDAYNEFHHTDYSIIHNADNVCIGCLCGAFVSKSEHTQDHDVQIKFKRFLAWGTGHIGASFEYIATYVLDRFDVVAGVGRAEQGIVMDGNSQHLIATNPRIEGFTDGIFHREDNTITLVAPYDTVNDPRWGHVGADYVDNTNDARWKEAEPSSTINTTSTETYIDPDWDGTSVDYDLDPSDTFPLEFGVWDGVGNGGDLSLTTYSDNTAGKKVDNLSSGQNMSPKLHNDSVFTTRENHVLVAQANEGYWQYAGNNVIRQHEIISDRITGRPAKVTKLYRNTGTPSGTNNGALTIAGTDLVCSNKTATVAENGTVIVNALTGASGAGGAGTYSLDQGDYIAPDHGTVSINHATGDVTYTPDTGYTGTDEMYVFAFSQEKWATVRITFLIGAGGAVNDPVVDTHFTATDHADANTIGLTLLAPPDAGGRRIDLVQYSTDAGVTWRRLCNGWVQAVHKITNDSTGTAISNGAYNVRIRLKTDFDFTTSGASADDAVIVT